MFARQLNPADTANFEAQFYTLPPEHQADVALKWRERCIDVLAEVVSPAGVLTGGAVAGAYGTVIGMWQGAKEAEAMAIVEAWEATGAGNLGLDINDHPTPFKTIVGPGGEVVHKAVSDPRKFLGMPRGLLPTAAFGVAAMATTPYVRTSRALRDISMGGIGYLTGTAAMDWQFKRSFAKAQGGGAPATP